MITGFTFLQNPVQNGYPFVEAILQIIPYIEEMIVVDMGSTDSTLKILRKFDIKLIEEKCTSDEAMEFQKHARNKVILHFYPNEIYSTLLIKEIKDLVCNYKVTNISALRIVVEQNFQRIKWYPHVVHRVFKRGNIERVNFTTNKTTLKRMHYVPDTIGYLWAFENCFKNNLWNMTENKIEPIKVVQKHFLKSPQVNIDKIIDAPHWGYTSTPLNIPSILRSHIGENYYWPYRNFGG
jgi:glycosyltransferase involved in cell wall biosynthesis